MDVKLDSLPPSDSLQTQQILLSRGVNRVSLTWSKNPFTHVPSLINATVASLKFDIVLHDFWTLHWWGRHLPWSADYSSTFKLFDGIQQSYSTILPSKYTPTKTGWLLGSMQWLYYKGCKCVHLVVSRFHGFVFWKSTSNARSIMGRTPQTRKLKWILGMQVKLAIDMIKGLLVVDDDAEVFLKIKWTGE